MGRGRDATTGRQGAATVITSSVCLPGKKQRVVWGREVGKMEGEKRVYKCGFWKPPGELSRLTDTRRISVRLISSIFAPNLFCEWIYKYMRVRRKSGHLKSLPCKVPKPYRENGLELPRKTQSLSLSLSFLMCLCSTLYPKRP